MAPKRPSTAQGASGKAKRARKVLSLETKIDLLDRLARGESAASVGRLYGINESTVRTIRKSEASIRASVASGTSTSAKVTYLPRDPLLEKMEKALSIWIEDQSQRKVPISTQLIRMKALKMYKHLVDDTGTTGTNFQASKGWFENFKKRHNLHNVQLVGESASADHDSAREYPAFLKQLIKDKGYLPEQVFNADETGLFWKRMPKRTFLSKAEKVAPGFKVAKDRLTLLFCGNASGDCFIKPLLVYKSLNPRALKGKNKDHLPVFWRATKNAWVTADVFLDWLNHCFAREVESYLKEKNLAFKVLLILDNAPGHPDSLLFAHPNIEVVFLPPNTTSLLQPMDQGLIATFKSYYVRRTFSNIVDEMDADPELTVKQCWKNYNIAKCLQNIQGSIQEIKPTTLNACWRKLWPEAVHNFEGFPSVDAEITRIVDLAKKVGGEGFLDLQPIEVEELLNSHGAELTEEDLEELIQSAEEDEECGEEGPAKPKLTIQTLSDILVMAKYLADKVVDEDPFMERSLKLKRGIEDLMLPYKEVLKTLQSQQKQTTILQYLKPITTTSSEDSSPALSPTPTPPPPPPRPSDGSPEASTSAGRPTSPAGSDGGGSST